MEMWAPTREEVADDHEQFLIFHNSGDPSILGCLI